MQVRVCNKNCGPGEVRERRESSRVCGEKVVQLGSDRIEVPDSVSSRSMERRGSGGAAEEGGGVFLYQVLRNTQREKKKKSGNHVW